MDNIYYICDRMACEKCESVCTHTTDASHAKNFYRLDGDLWEFDDVAPIRIQSVPELDSATIEHLTKSDEVVMLTIPRETIYHLIYEEKTQALRIVVPKIKVEEKE